MCIFFIWKDITNLLSIEFAQKSWGGRSIQGLWYASMCCRLFCITGHILAIHVWLLLRLSWVGMYPVPSVGSTSHFQCTEPLSTFCHKWAGSVCIIAARSGAGSSYIPWGSPVQGTRGGSGSVSKCTAVACFVHSPELALSPALLLCTVTENAASLSPSLSHCLHSLTYILRHHVLNSSLRLWL